MQKPDPPDLMDRLLRLASLTTFCCIAHFTPANAQLIPDNTLGTERSVVTPNVNIRNINSDTPNGTLHDRIDGGAVRGNNLFHSFQEFNVEAGRGVYFTNPDSIVNILTRVTGDNISNILGTLGVLGNANLFLINPNGIVFGPNARLDVGGSFFASTADSILFENGIEFAASNPQAPPLLTINIPIGLNLRDNPGRITVQGEGNNLTSDPNQPANLIPSERIAGLQVPPGQTLALVGGDINLTGGNLIAATGRIELGSVQAGAVTFLDPINQEFSYQNVTQFGNIQLSEAASVNVLGEGGGRIKVQGQSIRLSDGSLMIADTSGGVPGGGLNLFVVDTLELTGTSIEQVPSGLFANVSPTGTAPGGSITVNTANLLMSQEGKIATDTFGEGIGGNITINAQQISLEEGAQISTGAFGRGDSGTLTLNTQNLTLQNGSRILANSLGEGNGGELVINAENITLQETTIETPESPENPNNGMPPSEPPNNMVVRSLIAAESQRSGNSGNITITTNTLTVDGGIIQVDANAEGNAGSLTVNANTITITGANSRLSGNTSGTGNAGELEINSQQLTVNNGGRISSRTTGNMMDAGGAGSLEINTDSLVINSGDIRVSTDGAGNAGNLIIRANNINLTGVNAGLFADVRPMATGVGGTITIETQNLNLSNNAEIQAGTAGIGNAGNLIINADNLNLSNNAEIQTGTQSAGNAGNLTLNADNIQVRDGSVIASDTRESGRGNAGTLTINAINILVEETAEIPNNPRDRSGILVGTNGAGSAGELEVNSQQLTVNTGGRISSRTAGTGNAGTLEINTDNLLIAGGEILANTAGAGTAGDLEVTANNITIIGTETEGLMSGLFADVQREGTGDGGTITIQTQSLNMSNGGEIRAGTVGTGNAGTLTINADNIQVRDGAEISTDTRGIGNAGTLTLNADNILVEETAAIPNEPRERAEISVETGGTGNAGELEVNAQQLTVNNGGRISSRTEGTGNAGTLNINTNNLVVEGGEVQADTTGGGNAGNINVTANDIQIIGTETEGQSSGLFADVQPTGTGDGGTVTVNTGNLTVRDGGEIRVQSRGEGNPGSINVTASDIRLDRQGQLSARSATGQGGNITLEANDIRLRRQSEIEASGSQRNPTLDGNITIATSLLILLEESSITTNAFDPAGGSNIAIRALDGSNLTVIQSQTSTINAAGDLTIDTTLNFDPPETLNVEVINPEALIAQTPCQEGDESEFIITGRGGLPPNPTQGTRQRGVSLSLTEPVEGQNPTPSNSNRQRSQNRNLDQNTQPLSSDEIVPARGWIRTEDGEVILVSYDPTQRQPQRQIQRLKVCSPRN